jgi:hypothetical protein
LNKECKIPLFFYKSAGRFRNKIYAWKAKVLRFVEMAVIGHQITGTGRNGDIEEFVIVRIAPGCISLVVSFHINDICCTCKQFRYGFC